MQYTPVCNLGNPSDTVDIVLKAFATIWWDTPRTVKNVVLDTKNPMCATFQLVNGWRTYHIEPTTEPNQYSYQISVSGIEEGTKYETQ